MFILPVKPFENRCSGAGLKAVQNPRYGPAEQYWYAISFYTWFNSINMRSICTLMKRPETLVLNRRTIVSQD